MRISPISGTGALQHVHAPAMSAPLPADGPWSPAFQLVKKYGKDLLSLPGVASLGLNPHDGNTVRVAMVNEYTAAIAQRLLEPVLDGVKLELNLESTGAPYTGTATATIGDCVHAVAAMPGVWNYSYIFTPTRGTATFRVVDTATIARLDPLIRDHLEVGPDQSGNPRTFDLLWRAGLT